MGYVNFQEGTVIKYSRFCDLLRLFDSDDDLESTESEGLSRVSFGGCCEVLTRFRVVYMGALPETNIAHENHHFFW